MIDRIDPQIQETSEPVIENGAVLEENPDPIAAFDYDDDQEGWFTGFDDDYDEEFTLNSYDEGATAAVNPLTDRTGDQARERCL